MRHAPWLYGGALLVNGLIQAGYLWILSRNGETQSIDGQWLVGIAIAWLAVFACITALVAINTVTLFRRGDIYQLLRNMRTVKLLMIPFFVINFAVSLLWYSAFSVITMGLVVLVVWVPITATYLIFIPSTLYGAGALLIVYRTQQIGTRGFLLHLAGQLLFCLDLVSSALLFMAYRHHPKLSSDEPSPEPAGGEWPAARTGASEGQSLR